MPGNGNYEDLNQLDSNTLAGIAVEAIRILGERALPLSATPSLPSPGTLDAQTMELVNPLLNPSQLSPSIFGDERVKVVHDEANVVYVDDEPRHLRPVAFEVISILAANRGLVVGHDFMLKSVWPNFKPESYRHSGINPSSKISGVIHGINQVLGTEDLGHPVTGVIRTVRRAGHIALVNRDDVQFLRT